MFISETVLQGEWVLIVLWWQLASCSFFTKVSAQFFLDHFRRETLRLKRNGNVSWALLFSFIAKICSIELSIIISVLGHSPSDHSLQKYWIREGGDTSASGHWSDTPVTCADSLPFLCHVGFSSGIYYWPSWVISYIVWLELVHPPIYLVCNSYFKIVEMIPEPCYK